MYEEEEVYFPCSEDKGADQLSAPLVSNMQGFGFQMRRLISVTTNVRNNNAIFQIRQFITGYENLPMQYTGIFFSGKN